MKAQSAFYHGSEKVAKQFGRLVFEEIQDQGVGSPNAGVVCCQEGKGKGAVKEVSEEDKGNRGRRRAQEEESCGELDEESHVSVTGDRESSIGCLRLFHDYDLRLICTLNRP